jgi:hypothetical protein
MADAEQVKDAAEVYVYGCPLVYDLKEVASFVEGGGPPHHRGGVPAHRPRLRWPGPRWHEGCHRYSIGDRTPGLQTGRDGWVTIYLQTDSPGPGKDANWLPTPAGAFRPIMRVYQPGQPILDGTYVLPAVRKVG